MTYFGLTRNKTGDKMNSQPSWTDGAHLFQENAQQLQKSIGDYWANALQSFGGLANGAAMPQLPQLPDVPQISFDPAKLEALQLAYIEEASQLWNANLVGGVAKSDKRFASQAWAQNPVAAYTAALYLLNARTLLGMVEAAQTDPKTKARLRFAVEQWMAAAAPSNFLVLNA